MKKLQRKYIQTPNISQRTPTSYLHLKIQYILYHVFILMCFSTNVLMASMGFHHDFLSSLCSPHSTTFFFLPSPHYLLSALLTVLPKSPGRPWQLFTALMGHWEREAHVEEEKEAPWAKQHAGHTAGNTILDPAIQTSPSAVNSNSNSL